MYASLIGAGVSQLFDLYKSATAKSGSTDTSSTPTSASATSAVTAASATSAVKPTASTGASFSDAVQKLLVDLQAGGATSNTAAASADPTNTVAGDLQSVFKAGGKAHGGHGHHHASAPPASADATSPTTASNPFQGLASSLLAYAKNQNLGVAATSSTALTA